MIELPCFFSVNVFLIFSVPLVKNVGYIMDLNSGLKRAADWIQIPVVFTPIQNEKMKYKYL